MRGTRDIFGKDVKKFNKIEGIAKELLDSYGFGRIITPTFESTDLFKRGIGEGTDIVDKEMYTFKDRGDRSITLRPEGTAPVVRAYLENKIYAKEELTKYYYINNMFRYERPQAGRFREFYQIGVEVMGSSSPMVDAEVISIGYKLMKRIGLEGLMINLNSVGGNESRSGYRKKLIEFLNPIKEKLCSDCQTRYETNPLRVLDCKVKSCQEAIVDAPIITDSLNQEEKEHYETVKKYLDAFGVEYIENPKLVRGLDYYTSTVFEIITDKLGAQGTVLGGGRYDTLIEQVGGKSVPAVGFGSGLDRLIMLLGDEAIERKTDVYVGWNGDIMDYAFLAASKLRDAKLNVYIDYNGRSENANRKKAFKIDAGVEIILGEGEKESGTFRYKGLKSRDQETGKIEDLVELVKAKVEAI